MRSCRLTLASIFTSVLPARRCYVRSQETAVCIVRLEQSRARPYRSTGDLAARETSGPAALQWGGSEDAAAKGPPHKPVSAPRYTLWAPLSGRTGVSTFGCPSNELFSRLAGRRITGRRLAERIGGTSVTFLGPNHRAKQVIVLGSTTMTPWRHLLIAVLVAALPVQGALAASRALCGSVSPGTPASAHQGASAHGAAQAHGSGHAQHAPSVVDAHSHEQQATADTADSSPAPADDGRTCKMCAACSLAAVVAFAATTVPHALPDGAIDAPLDHAVPRARAGRLERPPKA